MELYIVRAEKEKMANSIHEYELKMSDMEQLKMRLEKQRIEEIERFKSDYQRQFKDQDFEIHRRRLAVDEDEHRISLEKDRLARSVTRLITAENELTTLRQDYYKIQHESQKATQELIDARDQLKTLNHNLKNMADAISSRERECKTLQDENRSLLTLHKALKTDSD